jgi:hypothetical protein
MATLKTYLNIAQKVYRNKDDGQPNIYRFACTKWEWATWYGDGFQGGIFQDQDEIIVGFCGTKGDLRTAPISQNTANLLIGCKLVPIQAGSANSMVKAAKKIAKGKPVTIVGHSLGGGLAQVVGNWQGVPFISLNGPGMRGNLRFSAFNIAKPFQMARSLSSGATDDTCGLSIRIEGDFVGNYGTQIGFDLVLDCPAGYATHDIPTIEKALDDAKLLNQSPGAIVREWPEWKENALSD